MNVAAGLLKQVKDIKDRSDMRCTAHWLLHERYARRAVLLDLAIMGLSTWLVAMAFVEPRIGVKLAPFGIDSQIFMGLLSVGTFFLTIFQLRTDFKGSADAHKRTFDLFAEAKRQAKYALAEGATDEDAIRRVISSYDMACSIGVLIPDAQFLALKGRHATKVAISRHLGEHPAASVFLTRVRFWIKDNFGGAT